MDDIFQNVLEGKYEGASHKITYGLVELAENFLTNQGLAISKHMPVILSTLNPHVVLPSKYNNFTRKLEKYKITASKDDIIDFLLPIEQTYLGPHTQALDLKTTLLESNGGNFEFPVGKQVTVGVICELERFRQKMRYSWEIANNWLQSLHIDVENVSSIQSSWTRVFKTSQKSRSHKKGEQNQFLDEIYRPPAPKPTAKQVLQEKLENPPALTTSNPLLEMAQHSGAAFAVYSNKMEAKVKRRDAKIEALEFKLGNKEAKLEETEVKLQETATELDNSLTEKSKLEQEIQLKATELAEEQTKISEIEKVYKPKNVKRREETKKRSIEKLEIEKKEQEKQLNSQNQEISNLKSSNEVVSAKLEAALQEKRNAQKLTSKYRTMVRNAKKNENPNSQIAELKEEVRLLENENEQLKERLNEFLTEKQISTFEEGRYTDEVRETYYKLRSLGVACDRIEDTIRIVLQKLSTSNCGRLPKKSTAAAMASECDLLAKMQVGQVLLEECNNTLHFDGTKKRFREYSSFQITTPSGQSLSTGIEEMPAGSANDYMEATKNIFNAVAELISTDDKQEKMARLLKNIKNLQSDRQIVNKNYGEQLSQYRTSFLPAIIENYHELSGEELLMIVHMNHLYCGLHVIIGLGTISKEALKEFENITNSSVEPLKPQQQSRVSSLLWEISKAFAAGHSYMKAGVVDSFEAYLSDLGLKNHIVSFRGERINIIFYLAAVVYYHRNHIGGFLDTYGSEGSKLLSSIRDIQKPAVLASIRGLGIFGMLVTSPLMRLIESEKGHIFELNKTWEHVVTKLDQLSLDARPLLEGIEFVLGGTVTKNAIYHELFQSEETDELTLDFLRLLCSSSAVLLRRQLDEQLPGGKFYSPSAEILRETQGAPKHNIISERDFAKLGAQLLRKPNMSTIAASGLICFANNKTSAYLNGLSEEKRHNMIEKAMKEAPKYRKICSERRREIQKKKAESLKAKKEARETREKQKAASKEKLTQEVGENGGLWTNNETMHEKLQCKSKKEQKKAVITQIKFRRVVMEQKVSDPKWLNISSGGKEHTLETLIDNLSKVMSAPREIPPAVPPAEQSVIRAPEERKRLIDEAVKRKSTGTNDNAEQSSKLKLPDLVGKRIMHKWEDNGAEKWCPGKVIKPQGDKSSVGCKFVVQYEDGIFQDIPLYEDYNNNDVIIIWYCEINQC